MQEPASRWRATRICVRVDSGRRWSGRARRLLLSAGVFISTRSGRLHEDSLERDARRYVRHRGNAVSGAQERTRSWAASRSHVEIAGLAGRESRTPAKFEYSVGGSSARHEHLRCEWKWVIAAARPSQSPSG